MTDTMPVAGLPDFATPSTNGILPPYGGKGPFAVLPTGLEVARQDDGTPDLRLQFYRGEDPLSPPAPYAVLDIRLEPAFGLDDALAIVRAGNPEAQLEPARFTGGFLRLAPMDSSAQLPPALLEPRPLTWNGLYTSRWSIRLEYDDAQLLKGALTADVLALVAIAEVEVAGVAPRLPVQAAFDRVRFFAALQKLADNSARVARNDLLAFFLPGGAGSVEAGPDTFGLQLNGATPEPQQYAEAMVDWLRARYATAAAAPVNDGRAYLSLEIPAVVDPGQFIWDLRLPLATFRPVVLTLDPIEAARKAVADGALDTIVPPPIQVPRLNTGWLEVATTANLPDHRPGVIALGTRVIAPPRPPVRPQASVSSCEFQPPDDRGRVVLRLSPAEPPQYRYQTYVIAEDATGVRELEGVETEHSGRQLDLTVADFPLRFIPVGVDRALTELAVLRGVVSWNEGGEPFGFVVELDPGIKSSAIPLPAVATDASLTIHATPLGGGEPLQLGPLAAGPTWIGLHSFPGYGPQAVPIEARFPAGSTPLVAVDLLPVDRPDVAGSIDVVTLTPQRPSRAWTYLAGSPFRSQYRFRLHPASGEQPGDWSEPRSPREPLIVEATP
jgi:hypothetical protein